MIDKIKYILWDFIDNYLYPTIAVLWVFAAISSICIAVYVTIK